MCFSDVENQSANSPSTDADLASGRLSDTSLNDVADVDLLHVLGLDAGLFKSVLDGGDAELGSRNGSERAVE